MKRNEYMYENKFAIFWIENNILFFEYKSNVIIDLLGAEQIVADRIQIQNGIAYPILCDMRGIIDSDKAARDYLAQHGSVLTKAVAIVVTNHKSISFLMITFYLKISKPQVPTKLFTDKTTALDFLKTFV